MVLNVQNNLSDSFGDTRGVMIHRYIDILYREWQQYTNYIAGACIDTHDIPSGGKNWAIIYP